MIIIAAIPAGLLAGTGVIVLFANIYAIGWTYAQDRLTESELVKDSHPKLSGSLRFWAKVYFSICYIFLASLAAGAFTAVFFLIAEAVKKLHCFLIIRFKSSCHSLTQSTHESISQSLTFSQSNTLVFSSQPANEIINLLYSPAVTPESLCFRKKTIPLLSHS